MNARLLVLLTALLFLPACGGKKKNSSQGPGGVGPIKSVNAEGLPELDKAIDDLDDGRLSAAPPANWFVFPKNDKYLAKFSLFKRGESPLPLIVITAQDSPFAKLETLTEAELEDFSISMTEIVSEKGGIVLEKVRPMIIGGVPCIRYVKSIRMPFRVPKRQMIEGEIQYLQTLAGGRLYTVELRVRKDTIPKFRDQAYAVLASLKFKQAAAKD